jgi:hypothetical protein
VPGWLSAVETNGDRSTARSVESETNAEMKQFNGPLRLVECIETNAEMKRNGPLWLVSRPPAPHRGPLWLVE